jgi:hypothetical protein
MLSRNRRKMKTIYIILILFVAACTNAQQKDIQQDFSNKQDSIPDNKALNSVLYLDSVTCGLNFKAGKNYPRFRDRSLIKLMRAAKSEESRFSACSI